MRIHHKLILGFLVVSLLAGIVGYVGVNTSTILKQQEVLSLATKDIQINILGALETTVRYINTDDPDKLTLINTKHHDYEEKAEMWIDALEYGTDSDEFRSEGFYQEYWVDANYESRGRSVIFDPEIGKLAERFEEIFKEFDELEEAVRDRHDKKVQQQQKFDENYNFEKEGRYNIRTPVFDIDDRQLTEDVGFLQYYSKETLYQHRDQKHLDEWLESIEKVRAGVIASALSQGEKDILLQEVDSYKETAQTMGQIAIAVREIEEQNTVQLEEVDKKVAEMEQKQQEILSLVETKTEQVRSRAAIIQLMSILLALVLSVLLGFFISRSISKPIEELTKASEELKKGNLDYEIETKSKDEIGQLAETFDEMRTELKRRSYQDIKDREILLNSLFGAFKGKFGNVALIVVKKNIKDLIEKNPRIMKMLPKFLSDLIKKERELKETLK